MSKRYSGKSFKDNSVMKKLLAILVLGLLIFNNVNAEERENELNNLFKQLKNSKASKKKILPWNRLRIFNKANY